MSSAPSWVRLQQRLAAGLVLQHVAGLRHPVATHTPCRFHAHSAIELVYHPLGRGVTTIARGKEVSFASGDVVLYAPGVRHDQRMVVDGEDCCVQIAPPPGLPLRGHLHVGRITDQILPAEIEYLSARQPVGSPTERALLNLRTTAVLLQVLELALVRREADAGQAEAHVRAAERYVHENHATIHSVAEIARAIGLGPDHLRHVFQHRRAHSLVAYLGQVRLARARALLAHSSLPLKQIATLCGYRDEYYFSAVFRRREGRPPGRYRTEVRRQSVET